VLSGDRRKTLANYTEDRTLSDVVLPYVAKGVITAKWGAKMQTYQVLELRIYRTTTPWHKPSGPLDDFIKNKQNLYPKFEARANELLGKGKHRVFVIMPIQGERQGDQEQQRIYKEYDDRFEAIERVLTKFDCVAVRIDKESPIDNLVSRIKQEIQSATFAIADLTDERQSCYYEAGYADALKKGVIFIASKNSVMRPGTPTKIHFDVHNNVSFFTNHNELRAKLKTAIEKNRLKLLGDQV
jgi:hypothetical protein